MPRKGYKSITVREEVYEQFKQEWRKRKEEYVKKGITSFSGFVASFITELLEKEDKKDSQ